MFGRRLTLFTLCGFRVRVDASWLVLAVLIVWSLGNAYFPAMAPHLTPAAHFLMALAGLLGLAWSILLHELAHSIVARHYGLPIGGITLFLFGGIAELEAEPETPKGEMLMAVAGPAMSLVLAILLHGGAVALAGTGAAAVLSYLGLINLLLAGFNLIPAFPMDGGRMLRAALWAWRGDLMWATRMASLAGTTLGIVVMAAGFWQVAVGQIVAGMWWVLIGAFVRISAAQALRQQAASLNPQISSKVN